MSASDLTTCRFLRERVFGVPTQTEFAELLGYTQGTISKFETGHERLSREAIDRIVALAERRKVRVDYRWFFEVPCEEDQAA